MTWLAFAAITVALLAASFALSAWWVRLADRKKWGHGGMGACVQVLPPFVVLFMFWTACWLPGLALVITFVY